MAKLTAKDRKKVQKAEAVSSEFEPLSPGKYIAELSEVEATTSKAGNPMWKVEFSELHDLEGDRQPGRQWYNLNLPTSDTPPDDYTPKGKKSKEDSWADYQRLCAGRIKQFFEVFGYSEDSDTDEMIGERCVLTIGIRTIQNGPRTGEQTNSVNGIAPLDSVEFEDAGSEKGGGSSDEF